MAPSSTDLKPESPTSLEQDAFRPLRTVRSVLLCGASVRSLAESAVRAGLRPLCVDFFEDQDLTALLSHNRGRFVGRIRSFAELPQITHSVRTSVPLLWAGGLENHTDTLRTIARRRPVIGADPDILDQLRHPARIFEWLTEAGLHVPRLATFFNIDIDCLWLRKPIQSSGGLGIRTFARSNPKESLELSSSQPSEYLQEYIDGVPMSAMFCSHQGRVELIGVSLQLIGWPCLGASDFLFCGNIGPVCPPEPLIAEIRSAAECIAHTSKLQGVFGIDFMLRQGNAWFLEVNPRLTASHMLYENVAPERQTSPSLITRHLAALGWKAAKAPVNSRSRRRPEDWHAIQARFILWAPEDFSVPENFATAFESDHSLRLADVPPSRTTVAAGSPLCSLHASATSVTLLAERIHSLPTTSSLSPLFSGPDIAQQVRHLFERYERNLVR